MKEKHTKAGLKEIQNRAQAVSVGSPGSADSREIERRRRKALEKQRKRKERRVAMRTEQNRRSARPYSLKQVTMLAAGFILFLGFTVSIIMSEASLRSSMSEVARLQERYETLQVDNDTIEANITAGIDVQEIYRIATEELGMTYPRKNQVVVYQRAESEHVKQNEDIPQD